MESQYCNKVLGSPGLDGVPGNLIAGHGHDPGAHGHGNNKTWKCLAWAIKHVIVNLNARTE